MADDRSFVFDSRFLIDKAKAEVPPPLVRCEPTIGEIFNQAFPCSPEETAAWEVVEAAVDLIANHYLINRDDVWCAVVGLEVERAGNTGKRNFDSLLESPWGFTQLGIAVVENLYGDAAADWPVLDLSVH